MIEMNSPKDYLDSVINTVVRGNSLDILKFLPDESIDCVMTSPPYWSLRDYGTAEWEGGDPACDHKQAKEKSRYDYDLSKARAGTQKSAKPGTDGARWKDVCPVCGALKKDKQLGLESTFQEYINNLCDIFDEIQRVLKPTGSVWVNISDTYSGSGGDHKPWHNNESGFQGKLMRGCRPTYMRKTREDSKQLNVSFEPRQRYCCECGKQFDAQPGQYFCSPSCAGVDNTPKIVKGDYPDKCLCCIPDRFKIEMINRGWSCRNEIIWRKPNCMPASVTDRFTVDYEKVYMFVKNRKPILWKNELSGLWVRTKPNFFGILGVDYFVNKEGENQTFWQGFDYFYEQQFEPINIESVKRERRGNNENKYSNDSIFPPGVHANTMSQPREYRGYEGIEEELEQRKGRNKRCVWEITTQPSREPHYASYPERLCETPILAGCPEGGIVLDPFMGTGTTGLVAKRLGRKYIGIELSPIYVDISSRKLAQEYLALQFEKPIQE